MLATIFLVWVTGITKVSVNDVIEKKIKEKDVEERTRKDRRNNMVIFRNKEWAAMSGKEKQEVDLKEVQKILKDCCEVELKQDNVDKVIQMGKCNNSTPFPIDRMAKLYSQR